MSERMVANFRIRFAATSRGSSWQSDLQRIRKRRYAVDKLMTGDPSSALGE
jgi:hypothetical protein